MVREVTEYTDYNYRIRYLQRGEGLSWLFFPGGPGIGSEYLEDFAVGLSLKGSKVLVDFPLDGSNERGKLDILEWRDGLIGLIRSIPNPILVAHSFSGMFALTIPELENHLKGIVLINSATKNSFFEHTARMSKQYNLPDLSKAFEEYKLNPSKSSYKTFWDTYKFYCFTNEEMALSIRELDKFAYNHASYDYIEKEFYMNYESKWSPSKIPTLTIASKEDYILDSDVYAKDPSYNRPNIMNKIITKAGHFPWLMHSDKMQTCFDEFCALYLYAPK